MSARVARDGSESTGRDDLREVGDAGEVVEGAVEEGEAVGADVVAGGHDHDLVEEVVDGGAQGGDDAQRFAVVAFGLELLDGGGGGAGGNGEKFLGGVEQQVVVDDGGCDVTFGVAWARMFFMRLKAAETARKSSLPRAAVTASERATRSRRSSAPAAMAALTTS